MYVQDRELGLGLGLETFSMIQWSKLGSTSGIDMLEPMRTYSWFKSFSILFLEITRLFTKILERLS